jgi:hypothetical protein
LSKLISELGHDKHGGEDFNAGNQVLQLNPETTHLVVIAELIDSPLPHELIIWLLLLNQSGQVLVEGRSRIIIDQRLDGASNGLLKACVLIEDECLS